MILIAHRGNTAGPQEDKENSPDHLNKAIEEGFDVEVDVWIINDSVYLGHDTPQYLVSIEYLKEISDKAWIHCKNFEALNFFTNNNSFYRYFWHEKDKFTLTSNGVIWTYPGWQALSNSIIVDLSKDAQKNNLNCYGICSDYLI